MPTLTYPRRLSLQPLYGMPALASVALLLTALLLMVAPPRFSNQPRIQLPVMKYTPFTCHLLDGPVTTIYLTDRGRFYMQESDSLTQVKLMQQLTAGYTLPTILGQNTINLNHFRQPGLDLKFLPRWLRAHKEVIMRDPYYYPEFHPIYHTAFILEADQCTPSFRIMELFQRLKEHGIHHVYLTYVYHR
ncbi:hypothetical protein [Hymenobacter rigui]|uniref:Uncharacterized protein n=1 Tax=Hymenobacter rigui TaxID=334424 RepID=A0A3R9N4T9_9BACT|nr:hypothetical protein [Hymenobacter rigui]RSK48254.1 hypothetical protein EI291_11005 [Hymenobacter rigui]